MARRKKEEYSTASEPDVQVASTLEEAAEVSVIETSDSETHIVEMAEVPPAEIEIVQQTQVDDVEQVIDKQVDVLQEMTTIFKSCPRSSVPSLVQYTPKGSRTTKYVIIDVPDAGLVMAWAKYKELVPKGDSEDFLVKVYNVTKTEIPRMYRAVAPVDLD